MSDDTVAGPPPALLWFSAGIRFFAPLHSTQPYFYPICLQAADNKEAIEKAWNLFVRSTYDKESGFYRLPGNIIVVPFHVDVVECTELFMEVSNMRASAGKPEKPKRGRSKSQGNVIDLFPKDGEQKGKDTTDEDAPPDVPPKAE